MNTYNYIRSKEEKKSTKTLRSITAVHNTQQHVFETQSIPANDHIIDKKARVRDTNHCQRTIASQMKIHLHLLAILPKVERRYRPYALPLHQLWSVVCAVPNHLLRNMIRCCCCCGVCVFASETVSIPARCLLISVLSTWEATNVRKPKPKQWFCCVVPTDFITACTGTKCFVSKYFEVC